MSNTPNPPAGSEQGVKYLLPGMIVGAVGGVILGAVTGNWGVWLPVGVGVGMALGLGASWLIQAKQPPGS